MCGGPPGCRTPPQLVPSETHATDHQVSSADSEGVFLSLPFSSGSLSLPIPFHLFLSRTPHTPALSLLLSPPSVSHPLPFPPSLSPSLPPSLPPPSLPPPSLPPSLPLSPSPSPPQIIDYTTEDHMDHDELKSALMEAQRLCHSVNEAVRRKENTEQLEWLQNNVQFTLDEVKISSTNNYICLHVYIIYTCTIPCPLLYHVSYGMNWNGTQTVTVSSNYIGCIYT